jgi:hypothetical protein
METSAQYRETSAQYREFAEECGINKCAIRYTRRLGRGADVGD